jgi:hypothetical protein
VSGYLIVNREANQKPLPPKAELGWWYQYYFSTERGRLGYSENRREFNKLIWQIASPKWDFDDDTFERTAASFDNPDHVDIVIHNYRWRLSLAEGEPQYGDLEARLFERPMITVPTVTIGSDFDGAAADGVPTRRSSPASTRIESSKALDTMCPKKPRASSSTPSSKSGADCREFLQLAPQCRRVTCGGSLAWVRWGDRLAQLASAQRGGFAGQGRPRRLLDLYLHQLALHARLSPRRGREVPGSGLGRGRRPHTGVSIRTRR